MVRTTSAPARHRRRKRLMKRAKGFWGDRKNHIRLTKDAVMRALAHGYVSRKKKKSEYRALWIMRISVAAKLNGISYSRFMDGLKKAGCLIDRKMLSELAIHDPKAFSAVIDTAKAALA